MKKSLPESVIQRGHPDFAILTQIAEELIRRGGGRQHLQTAFASMLRECIDDVVQTEKTGRRSYVELEKTEKTYIGTRVEIALRFLLNLQKGKLDTVILDHEVDIKFTIGNNWMIPAEAIHHPCILIAADESTECCYFGLFIAKHEYLSEGQNRDGKKSISSEGFKNIYWIFNQVSYPANFWRHIQSEIVEMIFSESSGNRRVAMLFRHLHGVIITRDIIAAVAKQKDFMRRLRSDDENGVRDILRKEGIEIYSGNYDKDIIRSLGLPTCGASEFISYKKI